MARNIDADKLCSGLEEMASVQFRYKASTILGVVETIKNMPTADVVPKSEVEELKAIIVGHKANEEQWQELYADTVDKWEKAYEELEIKLENAKTEVAMEIFEEIGKILYKYDKIAERDKSEYGELIVGDIASAIAELKKKYTEGEMNYEISKQ